MVPSSPRADPLALGDPGKLPPSAMVALGLAGKLLTRCLAAPALVLWADPFLPGLPLLAGDWERPSMVPLHGVWGQAER